MYTERAISYKTAGFCGPYSFYTYACLHMPVCQGCYSFTLLVIIGDGK